MCLAIGELGDLAAGFNLGADHPMESGKPQIKEVLSIFEALLNAYESCKAKQIVRGDCSWFYLASSLILSAKHEAAGL